MKFDNQLRYGSSVISAYRGEIPLNAWLKNYFRENKQMGSHDRKLVSNMVYGAFRLGRAVPEFSPEERILSGLFLCQKEPVDLLQYFRPEWNENSTRPLDEKISLFRKTNPDFLVQDIFPWKGDLSEMMDPPAFCLSFLKQPDLFLRIRPGYEETVIERLRERAIGFDFIPPFTIRLSNGSRAEEWFAINREIVIQDYSSQRTAPYLRLDSSLPASGETSASPVSLPVSIPAARPGRHLPAVWDACAASGGKSLLVWDLNPPLDLTVSDIRASILHNLQDRFREAGIMKYHTSVTDLRLSSGLPAKTFDLVIADVPCSGSGTWGRTPEDLCFFSREKIVVYSELQKRILSNLMPAVRPGGYFVYITCSVFREENENQVAFILEHSHLRLEKMELIKGYELGADTLFVARFIA